MATLTPQGKRGAPKPPALRARRNKDANDKGWRTLTYDPADKPELPDFAGQWHPYIRQMWADLDDEPIVAFWTKMDWKNAVFAFDLLNNAQLTGRAMLWAEARSWLGLGGLTLSDRQRLRILMVTADNAEDDQKARHTQRAEPDMSGTAYGGLRAV